MVLQFVRDGEDTWICRHLEGNHVDFFLKKILKIEDLITKEKREGKIEKKKKNHWGSLFFPYILEEVMERVILRYHEIYRRLWKIYLVCFIHF